MAECEYGQEIWNALMSVINNEFGVAGLMGNLVNESGLIPFRVQGDFSSGYTASREYTAQVDSGAVSEYTFVHTEQGYGLAQWTYYSRKQGLYDEHINSGKSIGSVDVGVSYLLWELKNNYTNVYDVLVSTNSILEASNIVLHDFESPADQSEEVELARYKSSVEVYTTYTGSEPKPPTPAPTTKKRVKRLLPYAPLWFFYKG